MADASVEESLTTDALRAAYAELADSRDDLRVQRWIMLGQPGLELQWVNSVGVAREPVLAAVCDPLPPPELRSITAATDAETFLWSGFVDACTFARIHDQYAAGGRTGERSVLDFGCGCGRLSRFFGALPDAWRAAACDINPDHVDWCREHLRGVDTRRNGATPPLPFDDRSMDLVYSLSVFSHLPPDQARSWIADLARVVRPGGVVVVTTHGSTALDVIAGSAEHQRMFRLGPDDVAAIRAEIAASGHSYRRLSQDVVDMAKVDEDYGHFFTGEDYVASTWAGNGLQLAAYLPGGLRGWQDIAVLRADVSA